LGRVGCAHTPPTLRLLSAPYDFFATVSRTFAIFEKGRWRLSGAPAKLIWAFIHILYLSGFENRLVVLLAWTGAILTRRGGARVIEDPSYAPLESGNSPAHSASAASVSTTKVP